MVKGKFNILVDAAWGSSGKGAAAARLADIHRVENLSSSNFPNAGHTVVISPEVEGGEQFEKIFTFKTLPSGVAVAWAKREYNPTLWIGPNSGFWGDQLDKEILETETPFSRLYIHPRAVMMQGRHPEMEAPGGKESTEHISSTMSGAGAAFAEKAMRKKEVVTAGLLGEPISTRHFYEIMDNRLRNGETFLHEVSQGFALSINHGTHYPHCTFRDCTPQQAMADFLVNPSGVGDVFLNIRSRPIRVGNNFRDGKQVGYSGDFYPDQREVTWEEVGQDAEMPPEVIQLLAEKERTTVTRKVRRVATQSPMLCQEAARKCGATKLIYNFPQYVHWSAHKVRGGKEALVTLHPKVRMEMDALEVACNLKIAMIGTGQQHDDYIWLD